MDGVTRSKPARRAASAGRPDRRRAGPRRCGAPSARRSRRAAERRRLRVAERPAGSRCPPASSRPPGRSAAFIAATPCHRVRQVGQQEAGVHHVVLAPRRARRRCRPPGTRRSATSACSASPRASVDLGRVEVDPRHGPRAPDQRRPGRTSRRRRRSRRRGIAGPAVTRAALEEGRAWSVASPGRGRAAVPGPRCRRGSGSGARPCRASGSDPSAKGASRVRSNAASSLRSRSGSSASRSCSAVEQGREGAVDGRLAVGRQPDDHAAAVVGVGRTLDQPARGQPVDAVGHRPAGHQGLAQQPAGGELVRRTRPPQRREHVELPRLDRVGGERLAAGQVEVLAPAG